MKHIEEVRKALDDLHNMLPDDMFIGSMARFDQRSSEAEATLSALEADVKELVEALKESRTYVIDYGSEKTMAPVIERLDVVLSKFTEAK